MESHAAVPHGDEVNRIGKVQRRVVFADDVVDDEKGSAADEHTDQRIEKEVLNLFFGQPESGPAGRSRHPEIDANEADEIGDSIPMNLQRPEMNRDRVDICRIVEPVLHSYRPYSDSGITILDA